METKSEVNVQLEALIRRSISGPIVRPRVQRTVLEVSAAGIDEYVQGFGLDADQSLVATGLRVPAFVTKPANRYVFQLATLRVHQAHPVRIRGIKVGINLGAVQVSTIGDTGVEQSRVVEFPVTTPGWHPPDGGWAFYLMDVPPMQRVPYAPTNGSNFIFRFADTGAALVYETATFPAGDIDPSGRPDFYTTLTAYTPPYGGRPLGRPIIPPFRDTRYPFDDPCSNNALHLDARSNRTIVLYAVIQQTNPSTRVPLALPDSPSPLQTNGLPPEEAFLLNFPTANIWRVFGAILCEEL